MKPTTSTTTTTTAPQSYWFLNMQQMTFSGLALLSIYCSGSEAATFHIKQLAKDVLPMTDVSDWAVKSVFVAFGYIFTFLITAGTFEYTNPKVKNEKRIANIKLELRYGISALLYISLYATTWLFLVDRHTPYYGYFETHDYTIGWFVFNVFWYLFWMDTFFYWSHRFLHIRKPINIWYIIHRHHHQFVDPTAFGQDAVHPVEAILQGK